jgi:hypothetical protein
MKNGIIMMADLKTNPLITILLAFLVCISAAMFAMMQGDKTQLWAKLDRVTNLMMEKENSLRIDIRDVAKGQICTDKDVGQIKERVERLVTLHPIGTGLVIDHKHNTMNQWDKK